MLDYTHSGDALVLLAIAVASALATFAVIPPLMPALRRYALARPNARSSHRVPTPQGGGIAVTGCAVGVVVVLIFAHGLPAAEARSLATLAVAALTLAGLGAWDDVRPLSALTRLCVQTAAVAASVVMLPDEVRLLPGLLPVELERALVVVGGVWFVNLTNFMDGLDWITAAQFVPLCAAAALLVVLGAGPPVAGVVAAALGGALLGFMPYNRPVARLFLGDVGSLPIGLLGGYVLVRLAGDGHLLAAACLPAYYLADATLTLGRRLLKGERVWEAHRSHFYQRATTNGLGVLAVVGRIAAANLVLAALALIAVRTGSVAASVGVAAVAVVTVAILLGDFSRDRRAAP